MRVIKLDASQWRTPTDFLTALRTAVGAPDWHGWNLDAFIDSMIWGDINRIEPPYKVFVVASENAPGEVRDYIALMKGALEEGRADKRDGRGIDTEVSLEVAP